jgi:opacity protein-like surface antigen
MKKLYIFLVIIFISVSVTQAQFTKIGGGLGFTTGYLFHKMDYTYNKSGNFNIFAKGIYEISLPVHISPSVTFFLPHVWKQGDINSSSRVTVSTLMFDLNGHYVFNSLDRFEFYGLAGLDIMLAWKKDVMKIVGTAPITQTTKEKDNAIGLNIGAGSYVKLTEQIDLNIEAKYLVSKYHQFMFNAGVLINLQWLTKNENQGI